MSYHQDPFKSIQQESFYTQYDQIIKLLKNQDQLHLFSDWNDIHQNVDQKCSFLNELLQFNQNYPGGLVEYINKGKFLLSQDNQTDDLDTDIKVGKPPVFDLSQLSYQYEYYESIGVKYLSRLAIVLVAGGLGERLGYQGIKIEIPFELVGRTTYLEHYCSIIKAIEEKYSNNGNLKIPFVIMTSNDTNQLTRNLLEKNHYYGLSDKQFFILKQQNVLTFLSSQAHLAKKSTYQMVTKPHGHGDIHFLIYQNNLIAKFLQRHFKYLLFIQDTNAQVFNAIAAYLGVSVCHQIDFNYIGVNRYPGESTGAITQITDLNTDKKLVCNIEYNQLDALLRKKSQLGDIAEKNSSFSPYPGNTNILLINLVRYKEVMEKTRGMIPEFINPKYVDETKTTFKSPARLETMMQDVSKLFNRSTDKVVVTLFDRVWSFSCNKNNHKDALKKIAFNIPPEVSASAEFDYYHTQVQKVIYTNNVVPLMKDKVIEHIPIKWGNKISMTPRFAMTLNEVRYKITGCSFEDESHLLLDGNIILKNVKIKAKTHFIFRVVKNACLLIENISLKNWGSEWLMLKDSEKKYFPEFISIRGYCLKQEDKNIEIVIDKPGHYEMVEKPHRYQILKK